MFKFARKHWVMAGNIVLSVSLATIGAPVGLAQHGASHRKPNVAPNQKHDGHGGRNEYGKPDHGKPNIGKPDLGRHNNGSHNSVGNGGRSPNGGPHSGGAHVGGPHIGDGRRGNHWGNEHSAEKRNNHPVHPSARDGFRDGRPEAHHGFNRGSDRGPNSMHDKHPNHANRPQIGHPGVHHPGPNHPGHFPANPQAFGPNHPNGNQPFLRPHTYGMFQSQPSPLPVPHLGQIGLSGVGFNPPVLGTGHGGDVFRGDAYHTPTTYGQNLGAALPATAPHTQNISYVTVMPQGVTYPENEVYDSNQDKSLGRRILSNILHEVAYEL